MFENNTKCKVSTRQDRGVHYPNNTFKYSCKQGSKQNAIKFDPLHHRHVLGAELWLVVGSTSGSVVLKILKCVGCSAPHGHHFVRFDVRQKNLVVMYSVKCQFEHFHHKILASEVLGFFPCNMIHLVASLHKWVVMVMRLLEANFGVTVVELLSKRCFGPIPIQGTLEQRDSST